MPPEHVNRDAVRERVGRLLDDYGRDGVYVFRSREPPSHAASFADLRGYADEGYLGGAYCLTVRRQAQAPAFSESMPDDAKTDGDRLLLALGRYNQTWGPPGGGREAGETFEETATREVAEEVGVHCRVTDVVAIRRVVVEDPDSDDEIHLAYVVFEGEYAGGSIDVQESEVAGAAWFGDLPERTHPLIEGYVASWSP